MRVWIAFPLARWSAASSLPGGLWSEDGLRIRANQGHSIPIDLDLEAIRPPELLFHGTATRFLESISMHGLRRSSRNHVHLSPDIHTAVKVGRRHGKPAVLTIQSGIMNEDGFKFYQTQNGVWLTSEIPAKYILFPDGYETKGD